MRALDDRRVDQFVKAALDRVGAAAGLLLCAPLLAGLALLVRLSLGRPVLFRQRRPGWLGAPFELVKFRTMRDGPGSDEDRLTAVGRWLRAWSLDELPELLNVLRGEMSFVGPRPLLERYLDRYTPEQARRHAVRPGITGWAQVHGRNALGWTERLARDVWYVDHWSLGLDLRILARTVRIVASRHGVSAPGSATAPEFVGVKVASVKVASAVPTLPPTADATSLTIQAHPLSPSPPGTSLTPQPSQNPPITSVARPS